MTNEATYTELTEITTKNSYILFHSYKIYVSWDRLAWSPFFNLKLGLEIFLYLPPAGSTNMSILYNFVL